MNLFITSMMSDDSVSRDPMPVSRSFLWSGSVSESDSDSLLGDGGLGGGTVTPTSTSLSRSELKLQHLKNWRELTFKNGDNLIAFLKTENLRQLDLVRLRERRASTFDQAYKISKRNSQKRQSEASRFALCLNFFSLFALIRFRFFWQSESQKRTIFAFIRFIAKRT